MRLLLDTCVWYWALHESHKLPKTLKNILAHEGNEVFVSPISFYEIAIKRKKYPDDFPSQKILLHRNTVMGFAVLPLEVLDINPFEQLPDIHKDPFDRLLFAKPSIIVAPW